MSSRLWKFRIRDILDAIEQIQSYVHGMTCEQFSQDRRTMNAVERNFILIGEAASQVPVAIREAFPEVPWREMTDMRNFIVHQYWGIDSARIWQTIHQDLPPLAPILKRVIAEASE